jgi:hypothetical protein
MLRERAAWLLICHSTDRRSITWPASRCSPFAVLCTMKVKVKCSRHTPRMALGCKRCSFYSFLTSTLEGPSGQHRAPAAVYSGGRTPRYPLWVSWVSFRAGLSGIEHQSSSPYAILTELPGSLSAVKVVPKQSGMRCGTIKWWKVTQHLNAGVHVEYGIRL